MENNKEDLQNFNLPIIGVPAPIIPDRQLNRYPFLINYVAKHVESRNWLAFINNNSMRKRYVVTPSELSGLLGLSRSRVYQLIKLKRLKSKQRKKYGRHFISFHAINEFLKQ